MLHLTYLDSNSWLIDLGEKRILLDPWLVDDLVFANSPWLFRGSRKCDRTIPDNIDLILLSQGLEDHAHPPTLKALDPNIPVVGSVNAAKVVQGLNYKQVTALEHGDRTTLADQIEIIAVPGSPIGPFLTENGYILRDRTSGINLYYEPHGYHSPQVKDFAPIDVVITPLVDLVLPVAGAFIQGQNKAIEVIKWLTPQVVLPTAAGGDVQFDGLINLVLEAKGTVEEFRQDLHRENLATQVIAPTPGERFAVEVP